MRLLITRHNVTAQGFFSAWESQATDSDPSKGQACPSITQIETPEKKSSPWPSHLQWEASNICGAKQNYSMTNPTWERERERGKEGGFMLIQEHSFPCMGDHGFFFWGRDEFRLIQEHSFPCEEGGSWIFLLRFFWSGRSKADYLCFYFSALSLRLFHLLIKLSNAALHRVLVPAL